MGYSLGIDLGATTCVVALRRGASVEVCRIGEDGAAMPAVALPRDDGTLLVGEQAEARSEYEPALVARYVVSRLGDGEPIDIDGHHLDPLTLTRAVLREAIDRAAPLPGVAPDHVVVTYPLLPGVGPEELIADAAAEEFGPSATLVPAPVAAVARLAAEQGFGDDAVLAVVDVGGSSVDVTLVRRTPTAFDLIGDPASLSDLGGVDLDGAVLSLVEGAIGDVSSMVAPGDSAGMLALRRLRTSCRAAKERLSLDHTAVVDVAMPNARGRVEITRDAFERTIEAALAEAVDLVMATIEDAGLIPADLRAVVVTGGSARIPRVTELLRQRTGLPVVSEDRPEATVALGAALFADVADDLAGPAGGAPGPLTGSTGSPSGSTGAGSGLGIAALGLGAAGAAAGLAGAGAAGADEGGITELPGLPLTGLESIPAIGPTTGGGPLPWEDAHPGAHGESGPPPEDRAPAWPDHASEEPPLWPDPPAAADAWAPVSPDPPADPWTSIPPDDPPADPWTSIPPDDAPADPWAAPAAGAWPAPEPGAAPADSWAAAPSDPWAAPDPDQAAPADPWGSAHDPWPSGPVPATSGDWGGPTDPWTSGAVPAVPGDAAVSPAGADDAWTTASDPWSGAPPAGHQATDVGWPATSGDDQWADRGPRAGAEARSWDDWGDASTTVFGGAADPAALPAGRSQDVEWGQTSDDEVRRLTTSDTDPFGRPGTLTSRLRDRTERREDDDEEDGRPFDVRILVGGLVAAAVLVIVGGYFALAGPGGGDDDAIAVADTAAVTSTTSTSTTTTTVPPTTAAPTTETTEETTTTRPRPRPTTTTTAEPAPPPPPPTAPPTTTPPTTPPTTAAPPTTTTTTTSTTTTTTAAR